MKWLLTLLCVTLFSVNLSAQVNPMDTSAIDAEIDALMTAYGVPGASITVVNREQTVYTQGYGVRNIDSGLAVDGDTVFSIGSVSKSFTALAIAQQVDAGTLDLDTPIIEYLPDFALSDPQATAALTLRHLLSNTGGFQPDDQVWYDAQITDRALIPAHIATLPIDAPPGEVYAYNNLGFTLAGLVLEAVTGQTWEEYIQANILTPLNMTRSTPDFDQILQIENHAAPHQLTVRAGEQVITPFANMRVVAPAGAIGASAADLGLYLRLHLGASPNLVSDDRITEMHTPIKDGYGLGWTTGEHLGKKLVWHNGSIDGYGAMVALVPSEGVGVALLFNADYDQHPGFAEIAMLRLIEITLGLTPTEDTVSAIQTQFGFDPAARAARFEQAQAFSADVTAYEAYVGDYTSDFGMSLTVRDGALYVNFTQEGLPAEVALIPFAPGQFIPDHHALLNEVITIRTADNGRIEIWQGETRIAYRGELSAITYTNPDDRFSVTIEDRFTRVEDPAVLRLTLAAPVSTFTLGTRESSGDLQADALAFTALSGWEVSGDPVNVNPLAMPDGSEWTQYVWLIGLDTVVVVNTIAIDQTAYFIALNVPVTDVEAILEPMNALLLSFVILE
ncbi:MAG: beta-lactamase family protein [Anaerolineae bacterium]|jgi:CubicO group peptidase (beta-lactamase class C family)|nr:beta-lactamase family protein [Anaerolineae bacterium]